MDLVYADCAMALAHFEGIHDNFQQGISYFRDKAKVDYLFID